MHTVSAVAADGNAVNRPKCHFQNVGHKQCTDHISTTCQSILMKHLSKCEELICKSIDKLYFHTEEENLEINITKATVGKLFV